MCQSPSKEFDLREVVESQKQALGSQLENMEDAQRQQELADVAQTNTERINWHKHGHGLIKELSYLEKPREGVLKNSRQQILLSRRPLSPADASISEAHDRLRSLRAELALQNQSHTEASRAMRQTQRGQGHREVSRLESKTVTKPDHNLISNHQVRRNTGNRTQVRVSPQRRIANFQSHSLTRFRSPIPLIRVSFELSESPGLPSASLRRLNEDYIRVVDLEENFEVVRRLSQDSP